MGGQGWRERGQEIKKRGERREEEEEGKGEERARSEDGSRQAIIGETGREGKQGGREKGEHKEKKTQ